MSSSLVTARNLRWMSREIVCRRGRLRLIGSYFQVDNAQHFHAAIEPGARNAQQFGGLCFVVTALGQSQFDLFSLDLFEQRIEWHRSRSCRRRDALRADTRSETEGQVFGSDQRDRGSRAR